MDIILFQFGTQAFILKGNGLLPSIMDPITVNAGINSASVHIINFANPLQFSVHLSIVLSGSDSKRFFLLHKKSNHIYLRQGGSVDIPIMFAPEKMYTHRATVTIITNTKLHTETDTQEQQNLCWEYPVYGQPELRLLQKSNAPKITCRAKQQLKQIVELSLVKSLENSAERCFKKPGTL